MDILDLIKSDEFQIPAIRSESEDFFAFVGRCLSYFLNSLKSLSNSPQSNISILLMAEISRNIPLVESEVDCIIQVLEKYREGKLSESYQILKSFLDTHRDMFMRLVSQELSSDQVRKRFFRLRKSDLPLQKKEEMFHIPFQSRHIIKTQRFSIPGLPCLYVGNSLFVCWLEQDMSSFEILTAVRLEAKEPIKILDFGNNSKNFYDIMEMYKQSDDTAIVNFLSSYILFMPLIFSCLVTTLYPNAVFKEEYIIPQFLIQYIAQADGIDGVRYPTTKEYIHLIRPQIGSNFAFPVKTNKARGLCDKLTNLFYSTDPMNLALFDKIPLPESPPLVDPTEIYFSKDIHVAYSSTKFYRYECHFMSLKTTKINSIN